MLHFTKRGEGADTITHPHPINFYPFSVIHPLLVYKRDYAKIVVAPGEAQTHNPGIPLHTVYKYRVLTDCATRAY